MSNSLWNLSEGLSVQKCNVLVLASSCVQYTATPQKKKETVIIIYTFYSTDGSAELCNRKTWTLDSNFSKGCHLSPIFMGKGDKSFHLFGLLDFFLGYEEAKITQMTLIDS